MDRKLRVIKTCERSSNDKGLIESAFPLALDVERNGNDAIVSVDFRRSGKSEK